MNCIYLFSIHMVEIRNMLYLKMGNEDETRKSIMAKHDEGIQIGILFYNLFYTKRVLL